MPFDSLPCRLTLVGLLVLIHATPSLAQSGRFDVLVSSRGTNSVKRYDGETGAYVGDFVPPGSGGLSTTQEVLFGPDGHLYVSGRGNNAILKYDGRTGAFLGAFTTGYTLREPTKMTYGPDGHLYVSQWAGNTTVARFDGITGAFLGEVTPSLPLPMQHAWNADGTLHVVSFGSKDVRRFDADGRLIDVFVSDASLQGPVNLWFNDSAELLVMDWQTGSVNRYDAGTGAFEGVFVSGLTRAEGWAYGPDGRLYIGDWGQHLVGVYDPGTGAFQETFIRGGGLQNPNSLIFFERWPDYTISASTGALTVAPGRSAQLELSVTPDRDLAYDETVTFSCSGPAWVTCGFSPASVVPGADGATATLTVGVSAAGGGGVAPLPRLPVPGAPLAILLLTAATLALASRFRGGGARWAAGLGLSLALMLAACGSDGGPAGPDGPVGPDEGPSQNATIVVHATSGPLDHTTTITITINTN